MICLRIKEERWDDVKEPDPADQRAGSDGDSATTNTLSQERNKTGLGEIYAEEFLAKSLLIRPEDKLKEDDSVVEIKSLFDKICRQLDSLSHFHFTPKPVVTEAGLRSSSVNLPSISMEDAIPTTESTSFGTAAPEDLFGKKRGRGAALMAQEELTSDDRRRLRQASKSVRKKQRKEGESSDKLASAAGKGSNKYESKKLDDALRADKRVVDGSKGGEDSQYGSYTKSSQFFEHLQKQAQDEISGKSKAYAKKKNTAVAQASGSNSGKFKL